MHNRDAGLKSVLIDNTEALQENTRVIGKALYALEQNNG
jgi:hypothetical protein